MLQKHFSDQPEPIWHLFGSRSISSKQPFAFVVAGAGADAVAAVVAKLVVVVFGVVTVALADAAVGAVAVVVVEFVVVVAADGAVAVVAALVLIVVAAADEAAVRNMKMIKDPRHLHTQIDTYIINNFVNIPWIAGPEVVAAVGKNKMKVRNRIKS